MNAAKSFETIDKILSAVDTFSTAVQSAESNWHWKKLRMYAQGLFDRGPYKVGDRVRLTRTPNITPNDRWGWMGAKHFLVAGAVATVASVDFDEGQFLLGLHFDDESWIGHDGTIHPLPDRRSIYLFRENWIAKAHEGTPGEPAPEVKT